MTTTVPKSNPPGDLNPKTNPKDSMKSTWRLKDRSEWSIGHWFFELLGIHHVSLNKDIPVHQKEEKVPYVPEWQLHRWVLVHSFIPIALQQLYVYYTGHNLNAFQAFILYTVAFKAIAVHELHALRRVGHMCGFLDGDVHDRDGVPDIAVGKIMNSLISTAVWRPVFTVFLSYRTSQAPDSISWAWLPFEIGIYAIVLDFWFYWYHRLMHEVDFLWKYHRTHHLTKHPNPLLTLYADLEQEFFDIAGVPLMTYLTMKLMGLPMGFYEWWICHQYIMFTELAGHSGIRVYAPPPSTVTWLLQIFKAEITIEDHDMHHRRGWKKSANYGKQTQLWDRVFGTHRERVECADGKVDWTTPIDFPLVWPRGES